MPSLSAVQFPYSRWAIKIIGVVSLDRCPTCGSDHKFNVHILGCIDVFLVMDVRKLKAKQTNCMFLLKLCFLTQNYSKASSCVPLQVCLYKFLLPSALFTSFYFVFTLRCVTLRSSVVSFALQVFLFMCHIVHVTIYGNHTRLDLDCCGCAPFSLCVWWILLGPERLLPLHPVCTRSTLPPYVLHRNLLQPRLELVWLWPGGLPEPTHQPSHHHQEPVLYSA